MNGESSIGRRFFEAQDRLRGGPDEALLAPGYSVTIGTTPPMDLAGHQQFSALFYRAFPDLRHAFDDVVSQSDKEVVRFRLQGTHQADFMGIPATGRTIDVPCIAILDVAAGKVTAVHGVMDQAALLQQLGVTPAQPQAR